jgi:hypothetical protein
VFLVCSEKFRSVFRCFSFFDLALRWISRNGRLIARKLALGLYRFFRINVLSQTLARPLRKIVRESQRIGSQYTVWRSLC